MLALRFEAESTISYLVSAGDGAIIQRISEPDRDFTAWDQTALEIARFLLEAG